MRTRARPRPTRAQTLSPALTDCPECEESTYVKQVTAAGFQLKGTGWYVTDFRDNKPGASASMPSSSESGSGAAASDASPSPAAN